MMGLVVFYPHPSPLKGFATAGGSRVVGFVHVTSMEQALDAVLINS